MPRFKSDPTDSTGHGLHIEKEVWCYFIAFFLLALGAAALGPTLTELAAQTDTSLKGISILFVMRSLGYLLTARIIGVIYDRSKGHGIMSMSLASMGALFLLVPFITNLWVLSPIILLVGVSGAFVDLGGNILILWAVKRNVGPSLNGLHFSFGLGAFISPLLVGLLIVYLSGYSAPPFNVAGEGSGVYVYWLIGIFCLPVAYWIYRTPSPDHPTVSKKYKEPPKLSPFLIGCIALFFFLYGGSEQSFGGWIHTYGLHQNNMDEVTAANLTSVFWGAIALGRLLAVPLTTRIQVHVILGVQVCGAMLTGLVMILLPEQETMTWICTGLMGLFMSSVFPLMLTFLERFVAGSGRLTSWFFIGASSGGMTLPWLIGQFFEPVGPLFFPSSVFVCMTIATGLCVFLVIHLRTHNN